MNINEFRTQLEEVKWLKQDDDYEKFDRLIKSVTGTEGTEWLDCLLDAICVEEDYGVYELLWNAIWRFPRDVAAKRLAECLPALQRRMSHEPSQVWRFYIPVPQNEQSTSAFLDAALKWNKEDLKTGLDTLKAWCELSGSDEQAWTPIYQKLGGTLPKAVPVDPVPDSYDWPPALKERLEKWRALPPDKNSERVFWFGGHETHMEEWKADLPRIVEALALRHGAKWRDTTVWINPLRFFAKNLDPDFIVALAKAQEDVRNRALANIKKARPATYNQLSEKLKACDIVPGKAIWPK